jgi:predicted permease
MIFYVIQLLPLLIMTTVLVNALLKQDWYWILTSSCGIIATIIAGAIYSNLLRKYHNGEHNEKK